MTSLQKIPYLMNIIKEIPEACGYYVVINYTYIPLLHRISCVVSLPLQDYCLKTLLYLATIYQLELVFIFPTHEVIV